MDQEDRVGGERTTCASTASSLNLRRANAQRPLTHSLTAKTKSKTKCAAASSKAKYSTPSRKLDQVCMLHTAAPRQQAG
jgi:hypothetical protein